MASVRGRLIVPLLAAVVLAAAAGCNANPDAPTAPSAPSTPTPVKAAPTEAPKGKSALPDKKPGRPLD
jgi:hypothetical protein